MARARAGFKHKLYPCRNCIQDYTSIMHLSTLINPCCRRSPHPRSFRFVFTFLHALIHHPNLFNHAKPTRGPIPIRFKVVTKLDNVAAQCSQVSHLWNDFFAFRLWRHLRLQNLSQLDRLLTCPLLGTHHQLVRSFFYIDHHVLLDGPTSFTFSGSLFSNLVHWKLDSDLIFGGDHALRAIQFHPQLESFSARNLMASKDFADIFVVTIPFHPRLQELDMSFEGFVTLEMFSRMLMSITDDTNRKLWKLHLNQRPYDMFHLLDVPTTGLLSISDTQKSVSRAVIKDLMVVIEKSTELPEFAQDPHTENDRLALEFIKTCPGLERLTVQGTGGEPTLKLLASIIRGHCPKLQYLCLTVCDGEEQLLEGEENDVARVIRVCDGRIKSLDLKTPEYYFAIPWAIPNHMRSLESLRLDIGNLRMDALVVLIAKHCTGLRELRFSLLMVNYATPKSAYVGLPVLWECIGLETLGFTITHGNALWDQSTRDRALSTLSYLYQAIGRFSQLCKLIIDHPWFFRAVDMSYEQAYPLHLEHLVGLKTLRMFSIADEERGPITIEVVQHMLEHWPSLQRLRGIKPVKKFEGGTEKAMDACIDIRQWVQECYPRVEFLPGSDELEDI